jgi:arylsulfatase A-like enzyme
VPTLARWAGTIAAASENAHQWYAGDLLATAADLAGLDRPQDIDSDSLLPTLRGHPPEKEWHRQSVLYWETSGENSAQAVRFGKWKAIRSPKATGTIELYDLSWDHAESRDHAPRRLQLVEHAADLFSRHQMPALTAE